MRRTARADPRAGLEPELRFSANWLELRAAQDRRARASCLEQGLRNWRDPGTLLKVVDLGAGSGANFRHLGPRLGGRQDWLLIDNDPELIGASARHIRRWAARCGLSCDSRADGTLMIRGQALACRVRTHLGDLSRPDAIPVATEGALVTCSALLDLVSQQWLSALARCCLARSATILWTLNYDGRIEFQPKLPGDALVRRRMNRHQRGDKGFGPALGPDSARRAEAALSQLGYEVYSKSSDWQIGATEQALQRAVLGGLARAAAATRPAAHRALSRWKQLRWRALRAGQSHLRVGHLDLLGLPPKRP